MLPTARSPASEKSNHNDAHGKNDDKTAAAMSSRGDVSSGNSPRKQQQLAGKVESRQASTFGGGHPEIVDKSSQFYHLVALLLDLETAFPCSLLTTPPDHLLTNWITRDEQVQ